MATRYRLRDAGDQWSIIVAHVERGEAVELVENGEPVALITPLVRSQDDAIRCGGFWDTLEQLRREYDVDNLDVGPHDFVGLRDRFPGRDVAL